MAPPPGVSNGTSLMFSSSYWMVLLAVRACRRRCTHATRTQVSSAAPATPPSVPNVGPTHDAVTTVGATADGDVDDEGENDCVVDADGESDGVVDADGDSDGVIDGEGDSDSVVD